MQARRHQYLNAMGIQVWQLRDGFSGAEPVVEGEPISDFGSDAETFVDKSAEAESVFVDDTKGRGENSPAPAVVVPDEVKPTITKNLQSQVISEPEKSESFSPITAEPNPEFRLASIIFPNSCVVITQVPIEGTEPITGRHLSFLKNVLSAMGTSQFDEPLVTFFNWPMLRSPGFDQGESAARQASQAFLNGQKSKHAVPFVLLMGADTGRYLLPSYVSFSESQGRLLSETEQPRLLTHSIDEIFAEPTLKAAFWHDIQALRVYLVSA